MNVITVTNARKALHKLAVEVAFSHKPLLITGRNSRAVLVSEDDWNAISETLHLLSLQGMRASIIEGLKTPLEDCDEFIEWQ
jgi:antitoxin YefM